jgi:hypothetical protein
MKYFFLTLLSLSFIACGQNNQAQRSLASTEAPLQTSSLEEIEDDSSVLNPEMENEFLNLLNIGEKATAYRFAQTSWKECSDEISGNYEGYKCASSRGISVILKHFVDTHIYKCVDAGLAAQGGGVVDELHIVHAGIQGDRNHSPRSLHAEARAVDIRSLEMRLTNGKVKNFVYKGTANRAFYTAFRKCWGQVVHNYNGCPYYRNDAGLTGSIGWENKDHQNHMHTSVPYCVKGSYGSYYYQK